MTHKDALFLLYTTILNKQDELINVGVSTDVSDVIRRLNQIDVLTEVIHEFCDTLEKLT